MSRGSFVDDLLCAQLHPPGSCRMVMMVVHMMNPNEHETAAYLAMIAHVNESLKPGRNRVETGSSPVVSRTAAASSSIDKV